MPKAGQTVTRPNFQEVIEFLNSDRTHAKKEKLINKLNIEDAVQAAEFLRQASISFQKQDFQEMFKKGATDFSALSAEKISISIYALDDGPRTKYMDWLTTIAHTAAKNGDLHTTDTIVKAMPRVGVGTIDKIAEIGAAQDAAGLGNMDHSIYKQQNRQVLQNLQTIFINNSNAKEFAFHNLASAENSTQMVAITTGVRPLASDLAEHYEDKKEITISDFYQHFIPDSNPNNHLKPILTTVVCGEFGMANETMRSNLKQDALFKLTDSMVETLAYCDSSDPSVFESKLNAQIALNQNDQSGHLQLLSIVRLKYLENIQSGMTSKQAATQAYQTVSRHSRSEITQSPTDRLFNTVVSQKQNELISHLEGVVAANQDNLKKFKADEPQLRQTAEALGAKIANMDNRKLDAKIIERDALGKVIANAKKEIQEANKANAAMPQNKGRLEGIMDRVLKVFNRSPRPELKPEIANLEVLNAQMATLELAIVDMREDINKIKKEFKSIHDTIATVNYVNKAEALLTHLKAGPQQGEEQQRHLTAGLMAISKAENAVAPLTAVCPVIESEVAAIQKGGDAFFNQLVLPLVERKIQIQNEKPVTPQAQAYAKFCENNRVNEATRDELVKVENTPLPTTKFQVVKYAVTRNTYLARSRKIFRDQAKAERKAAKLMGVPLLNTATAAAKVTQINAPPIMDNGAGVEPTQGNFGVAPVAIVAAPHPVSSTVTSVTKVNANTAVHNRIVENVMASASAGSGIETQRLKGGPDSVTPRAQPAAISHREDRFDVIDNYKAYAKLTDQQKQDFITAYKKSADEWKVSAIIKDAQSITSDVLEIPREGFGLKAAVVVELQILQALVQAKSEKEFTAIPVPQAQVGAAASVLTFPPDYSAPSTIAVSQSEADRLRMAIGLVQNHDEMRGELDMIRSCAEIRIAELQMMKPMDMITIDVAGMNQEPQMVRELLFESEKDLAMYENPEAWLANNFPVDVYAESKEMREDGESRKFANDLIDAHMEDPEEAKAVMTDMAASLNKKMKGRPAGFHQAALAQAEYILDNLEKNKMQGLPKDLRMRLVVAQPKQREEMRVQCIAHARDCVKMLSDPKTWLLDNRTSQPAQRAATAQVQHMNLSHRKHIA